MAIDAVSPAASERGDGSIAVDVLGDPMVAVDVMR